MDSTSKNSINEINKLKENMEQKYNESLLLQTNYSNNKKQILNLYKEINDIIIFLNSTFRDAGRLNSLRQLKLLKSIKKETAQLIHTIKLSMLENQMSPTDIEPTLERLVASLPFDSLLTLYEIKVILDTDGIVKNNILSPINLEYLNTTCNDFYNRASIRKESICNQYNSVYSKLLALKATISLANQNITILNEFKFSKLNNSDLWKTISIQYFRNTGDIILKIESKDGTTMYYQVIKDEQQIDHFSYIDINPTDIYTKDLVPIHSLTSKVAKNEKLLKEIEETSNKINVTYDNAVYYKQELEKILNTLRANVKSTAT